MERARTRLVLIGASNLWLGLPALLRSLDARRGPYDVFVASGHGRSYGAPSRYLARDLGSILECGMWSALGAARGPCAALVTDVGNDLAYGWSAATIAGWFDEVLARLAAADARVVTTGLPLASLEALSPLAFQAVRLLVYRGRPLQRELVLREARALDQRLAELAHARGTTHVRGTREDYGWDGIHLRQPARAQLFAACLGALALAPALEHGCRFRGRPRPALRRLFGREQRFAQPCASSDDGSRLWVF